MCLKSVTIRAFCVVVVVDKCDEESVIANVAGDSVSHIHWFCRTSM